MNSKEKIIGISLIIIAILVLIIFVVVPYIQHEIYPDHVIEPSDWSDKFIDSDGDGIKDEWDECQNTPENFDGYNDHDGCPEDLESFDICMQNGGRVWPHEYGCTDEHGPHPIPYNLVKEKCKERGGKWVHGSEMEFCKLPVNDEGKQCIDSSQCEDICKVEKMDDVVGICTRFSGGCDTVLNNGKTSILCS